MIKLISRQNQECNFLETGFNRYILCRRINSVLDQIDYDKRFLCFKASSGMLEISSSNVVEKRLHTKNQCTQTDGLIIGHGETSYITELTASQEIQKEKFFRAEEQKN